MPNINLRDGKKRDAQVRAEHLGLIAEVRYVDAEGEPVRMRKVLKATIEHTYDRLAKAAGDADKLAAALVEGDPDVDIERVGMFLAGTSRVYVNEKGEMVHNIAQTEIVRGVDGIERERRPRHRAEPNVDAEIPISWTGRLIKKDEALRRFVFSSKLQIAHINGLTYDFLFGMAKELAEANSLMLLGGGKSGRDPLIFRRGMTPHRGFLEGRVDGAKYVLLLHLSKLELKRPAPVEQAVAEATTAVAATDVQTVAAEPIQITPLAEPVTTVPMAAAAPTPTTTPVPASPSEPHKPTVADVLGSPVSPLAVDPVNAKRELEDSVTSARARTSRKKKNGRQIRRR